MSAFVTAQCSLSFTSFYVYCAVFYRAPSAMPFYSNIVTTTQAGSACSVDARPALVPIFIRSCCLAPNFFSHKVLLSPPTAAIRLSPEGIYINRLLSWYNYRQVQAILFSLPSNPVIWWSSYIAMSSLILLSVHHELFQICVGCPHAFYIPRIRTSATIRRICSSANSFSFWLSRSSVLIVFWILLALFFQFPSYVF